MLQYQLLDKLCSVQDLADATKTDSDDVCRQMEEDDLRRKKLMMDSIGRRSWWLSNSVESLTVCLDNYNQLRLLSSCSLVAKYSAAAIHCGFCGRLVVDLSWIMTSMKTGPVNWKPRLYVVASVWGILCRLLLCYCYCYYYNICLMASVSWQLR